MAKTNEIKDKIIIDKPAKEQAIPDVMAVKNAMLGFLKVMDTKGYRKLITAAMANRMVGGVLVDGTIKEYSKDMECNSLVIVSSHFFQHSNINDGQSAVESLDATIVEMVEDLPPYFLQGNNIIKKSLIASDEVAMKQKSWHQLPSASVLDVMEILLGVEEKLSSFNGKILI